MRGIILDTVGAEIEGEGLTTYEVSCAIPSRATPFIRIAHDASVEVKKALVGNIYVVDRQGEINIRSTRIDTSGYEIITEPLSVRKMEQLLWDILPAIFSAGEFISNRASLHIHVGMAASLSMLKAMLRLAIKLDPLLFSIGSLGRNHRGFINDFTYCRPLNIGPIVKYGRGYYRIPNIPAALEADSIKQFWLCFGVDISNVQRYHPARYFGVNLLSMLLHGTLEIRHTNQVSSPGAAVALMKFYRAICVTLLLYPQTLDLPYIDLRDGIDVRQASLMLRKVLNNFKDNRIDHLPSPKEEKILESLLQPIAISDDSVMTHLRDFTIPEESVGVLSRIRGPVKSPEFVDIHNIENRDYHL